MKKIFFMSLLSFIPLLNCSVTNQVDDKEFKVVYFDKKIQQNIKINEPNQFLELINNLVLGVDDLYKLIVTNETIKEIKDNNSGIEILFSNEMSIDLAIGTTLKFKKILIPFVNKSDSTEKASEAVLYCGGKKYFTPPYVNSKGSLILEEIRAICIDSMNKK